MIKNLEEFKAFREIPGDKKNIFCYAPFVNLDIDQTGRVTACCYSRDYELGRYPEKSLMEIWNGAQILLKREKMKSIPYNVSCDQCIKYIEEKNFSSVQVTKFDFLVNNEKTKNINYGLGSGNDIIKNNLILPRSLGLHLSNLCNLECIMCGGRWSSLIRKNREKLPPLPYIFDDKFFEEIKNFLPFLLKIDFLGGEPFLLKDYYKLWDEIIEKKYSCRVSITTNGTVMNNKVENVLLNLKTLCLVISCDSLVAENYEKIRLNSKFDLIKANLEKIKEIHKIRKQNNLETNITIAVCPMPINYKDIPGIIEYCNLNSYFIHFNTVNGPLDSINNTYTDLTFRDKDISFLKEVYGFYADYLNKIKTTSIEKNYLELVSLNSFIESLIIQKQKL